jgi:hypothetical protein
VLPHALQVVHFDEMDKHVRDDCENTPFPCGFGCGKDVTRGEWSQHAAQYCLFRRYPCSLCGVVVEHKLMFRHQNRECMDRLVACELGCGSLHKAREKAYHQMHQCSMQPTECACGLM